MVLSEDIGKSVLELGCGIHKIVNSSVAIDKSPVSKADIVRDFARRGIPFNDSSFDTVLMFDVIEHIEDYEDVVFVFNEIHRVLRVGGKLYLTTPNGRVGWDHMTHSRVFHQGSFDYLMPNRSQEEEYIRASDGISARFKIEHIPGDERQLEILFTKV